MPQGRTRVRSRRTRLKRSSVGTSCETLMPSCDIHAPTQFTPTLPYLLVPFFTHAVFSNINHELPTSLEPALLLRPALRTHRHSPIHIPAPHHKNFWILLWLSLVHSTCAFCRLLFSSVVLLYARPLHASNVSSHELLHRPFRYSASFRRWISETVLFWFLYKHF